MISVSNRGVIKKEGGIMQDTDYRWFVDNYQDLFHEYGENYLAIKDKRVIGAYSSFGEAVRKTAEKEPLGSFIVQLCNGNESAYTNYIASVNYIPA